jgi:hypothetical protein
MLALIVAGIGPMNARAEATGKVTITSKDNKALTFKAGEKQKWTLVISNGTDVVLSGAVLAPELGEKSSDWPFKTEYQQYQKELDDIQPGESQEVTFEFTQREDVKTTRYVIPFEVKVGDEVVTAKKLYVNTTAKEETKTDDKTNTDGTDKNKTDKDKDSANKTDTNKNNTNKTDTNKNSTNKTNTDKQSADKESDEKTEEPTVDEEYLSDSGDYYSNDTVSYSSGESESTSVPRVIVTGFSTDPSEVHAGSDFTLTVHLKNTSKTTKVSNMLFDFQAPTEGTDEQTMSPAFLPTSGASSVYLDGIASNGTADISIRLNAKSDLLQKPYSIELGMKYEDANGAQVDATSSLSIPVKQDARFEFSKFEISPESISVGGETNVMCSLYNLGKIKLYNVKATFEGECIETEEVFIGNVESGSSASIDAMLTATQASNGAGKITMTLSYEDESGNISTSEEELEIQVTENQAEDVSYMEDTQTETGSGIPIWPFVLLAAIIVAVVIVIKKRKKKQEQSEEEELLDELDRSSEDEQ